MSTASDVCRRAFEAWNRGDLDGVVSCYAPDAVIHLPEQWPDAGRLEGREAIRAFYASYEGTWREGSRVEPLSFEEQDDQVVVRVASQAQGRRAGIAVDFDYTMTFTVMDGRITRVEFEFGHEGRGG